MVQPLVTISTVQAVENTLREMLLEGELDPGEPLFELEVAGMFRVSRPTAKAAIESLVSAGLLVREANKPAHVAGFTADDIKELGWLIKILADAAFQEIQQSGPDEAKWQRILAAMEAQGPMSHLAYARVLARESGSPRLRRELNLLLDQAELAYRQAGR